MVDYLSMINDIAYDPFAKDNFLKAIFKDIEEQKVNFKKPDPKQEEIAKLINDIFDLVDNVEREYKLDLCNMRRAIATVKHRVENNMMAIDEGLEYFRGLIDALRIAQKELLKAVPKTLEE